MCAYPGGKARGAEHILSVLNNPMWDGYKYIEPMCGMCHILRRVVNKSSYSATDNNKLLIHLLRSVKGGCTIPHITRERYGELRAKQEITLERAVAAHTFSFNGKFFSGYTHTYTRPDGRVDDMARSRRNYYKKLEANKTFKQADLRCCEYSELTPSGAIVFADPPYRGTTRYGNSEFDSDRFWSVAREWSVQNYVFVSEYSAPTDWICIAFSQKYCSLAGGDHQSARIERLFIHETALDRIRAMPGCELAYSTV
jgi:DNA adenine methylase